jgi:plasmid segregation protein ParM
MNIVRSIDIGYSYTKFTSSTNSSSELSLNSVMSIAPRFINKNNLLPGRGFDDNLFIKNNAIVDVGSNKFVVGPHAELMQRSNKAVILHKDFIGTDTYKALMKGALYFINEPVIDMLVVGLPVAYIGSNADKLKNMLVGNHPVNENFMVEIKDVLVVPQPQGGYTDFAVSRNLMEEINRSITLSLDPGMFSFDWFVSKGFNAIQDRCGSNAGGVHSILNDIIDELNADLSTSINDIRYIDECILNNDLIISGKKYDISHYISKAKNTIGETIGDMLSSIKDTHDIRRILLFGGGSHFYEEQIKSVFSNIETHLLKNPRFANVRGYQIIGEQILELRQWKAA